jgi:hypothetical protein
MQEVLHVVRCGLRLAADIGIGVSKARLDDVSRGGVQSPTPAREVAKPKNRISSDVEGTVRREAHTDRSCPFAVLGVQGHGEHCSEQFLGLVAFEGRLHLHTGHPIDGFVLHSLVVCPTASVHQRPR